MVATSIRELRRFFEAGGFARGVDYFERGRVIEVDVQQGRSIDARVRGSGGRTYRQSVTIDWQDGRIDGIAGRCSCPMAINCKHVAAVVLAAAKELAPRPPAVVSTPEPDALPYAVKLWLGDLKEAERADEADGKAASGPGDRLFYVFRHDGLRRATIETIKARRLKTGGIGATRSSYSTSSMTPHSPPKFLEPEDVWNLRLLRAFAPSGGVFTWPEGERLEPFLRGVVATGRAHARDLDGPALRWKGPLACEPHWRMNEAGEQALNFTPTGGALEGALDILPFAPPMWIDRASGACGLIASDLTPKIAARVAAAPTIPAAAATLVSERLAESSVALPTPETVAIETLDVEPTPVLTLLGKKISYLPPGNRSYGSY